MLTNTVAVWIADTFNYYNKIIIFIILTCATQESEFYYQNGCTTKEKKSTLISETYITESASGQDKNESSAHISCSELLALSRKI